jgi:flotillin
MEAPFMFGWHVPAPDEAMLISGKKHTDGGLPFRIVTGHGAFVLPIRNRVSTLSLAMQESEVAEECVTKQGIALLCRSVIAFKVGDDNESIANAARRFLDDQDHMSALTGRIFAGHLRSIIGSMTVEELIRERQRLAEVVLDASKPEMEKIGLVVDSLQIQSIDDRGSGYIAALAAPHQAAVQRDAQVAQAQAQQAAAQAQQESLRNQAQYERETEVTRAGYKADIDKAQAQSAQAGPLAQAEAQQAVIQAQAELAVRNAELKEKELVATVEKPAEAEAFRIRTIAEAEAQRTRIQAEATATGEGIALQRMLVEKMPEIIGAAASQLANANVTVLNGADGMGQLLAGFASQAGQLMRIVQDGLGPALGEIAAAPQANGATPADEPPDPQ